MSSILKVLSILLLITVFSCNTVGKNQLLTSDVEMEINERILEVMSRSEFNGARWGMEFYIPKTNEVIYSHNGNQFFTPASSMKVFTAGTAFEYIGVDYHFHTPVYRTGPIIDGVLRGDLVIKASGDLLLGGRVNEDGSINLPSPDHTYDMSVGAGPVSNYTLQSIQFIADQIAASGIKHIEGNIFVDNSLFREEIGEVGGTGAITVSSMIINDNLIDVTIVPASIVGAPAELHISPESSYLTVINETITTSATGRQDVPGGFVMMGSNPLRFINNITNDDGTNTVTLTGEISLDSVPAFRVYRIPEPDRFAEIVLGELLYEKGITVQSDSNVRPDFAELSRFYFAENVVAELLSPSLDVQVLPMLKLSSNPHTVTWYYLIGAIAGGESDNAYDKGKELQTELFEKAGVESLAMPPRETINALGQVSNVDRAFEEEYMPSSFTNFLTYIYRQPYFERFKNTLPVLGIDGTLAETHSNSQAAGNVFAKTGTAMQMRRLDGVTSINIKAALAGFIELPNSEIIVFSVFLEYSPSTANSVEAHETIGDIVNIVYEAMSS